MVTLVSVVLNIKLLGGSSDTMYVMGNSLKDEFQPYYKYLSPNISFQISYEHKWTPILLVYYIPMIVNTLIVWVLITKSYTFTKFPFILALFLSQLIMISGFIKMVFAHVTAYIISCCSIIENNDLIGKMGNIHKYAVSCFMLTCVLFGYVLSELKLDDNYARAVFTIIFHTALNFIFWSELCRFFKYDQGEKRGTFICFYGDNGHDLEEEHAQFFLLFQFVDFRSNKSKHVNWYFGTGNTGKCCIVFSYLIFPVICQTVAYMCYAMTSNTIAYISIVNLSHLFFGIALIKSVLYGIYRGGEIGIDYCKTKCTNTPPLADYVSDYHNEL